MLKPEFKESNLTKGVPRIWLLEEYDRLLFIIQIFFTCEGRYSWVLQCHFKLLLHFTGKKEIDLPFFLFMSLQRMISKAQRKPEKLEKSIFHHALIKLIVMEKLKKEGKDWSTFLFVSNYQVDLPTSPPKYKKPRKQSAGSSSTAVVEIPQSPIAPVFKEPFPIQIAKKDKGKGKAKKISIEEREE